MSQHPYRAVMRPRRGPPIVRPNSPAAAAQAAAIATDVSEAPEEPVATVEAAVEATAAEVEVVEPAPVVEAVAATEEVVEPTPVATPEPVEPVAVAPVVPKVNSASNKTDLLAAAAVLGITSVSATNTRAEIWAAIQAATTP